jgi:hypothetical protein
LVVGLEKVGLQVAKEPAVVRVAQALMEKEFLVKAMMAAQAVAEALERQEAAIAAVLELQIVLLAHQLHTLLVVML